MTVIVCRENERGTFDGIGTTNQTIIRGLKTRRGIIRRAEQYARGKSYRIEWFAHDNLYHEPTAVTVHGATGA